MFARTDRLLLRPGFIEDAGELASAIGDIAVARNLSSLPWPYRPQDAADFLALPEEPLLPRLLIVERTVTKPRIIGGIGIHWRGDDGCGVLELGYWIARAHWGRGFATEAGRAVMQIARTNRLPSLCAAHFIDNPASANVLRKLGFRSTGRTAIRTSAARGGDASCAHYEEADAGAGARGCAMQLAA